MKKKRKIYYLDLPDPNASRKGGGESEWTNIDIFFTREDAEFMLSNVWGIDKKYTDLFITEGWE